MGFQVSNFTLSKQFLRVLKNSDLSFATLLQPLKIIHNCKPELFWTKVVYTVASQQMHNCLT